MTKGRKRPTAAEFIEFAKRSEMLNLDMPVAKLLDAVSTVEQSMEAASGGWILINEHYLLWTGAIEDLQDPVLDAPVRTQGIEG